jgi:CheY-like chemotaxis protein
MASCLLLLKTMVKGTSRSREVETSSKRVLVVDDNEILLHAWRKMLRYAGYIPVVTTHPEDALREIASGKIDLLICDIVMPQVDGFDLLKRIRADFKTLKVVFTTGYACNFQDLEAKISDPNIHVLLKPYNNISSVLRFVQKILDQEDALEILPQESTPQEVSTICRERSRVHLWNL